MCARLRGKYWAMRHERNFAPHDESRENQRESCDKQNETNTNN
jgi:hypothetical protein